MRLEDEHRRQLDRRRCVVLHGFASLDCVRATAVVVCCRQQVDYLVARHGGWDTVRKWEDVLSLGEQQRIGCARLFYHSPAFAVLDECTSAVSIDVEEALYKSALEHGITSITISQRLALEEFHSEELAMGVSDNELGWKLRSLRAGSE